MTQLAKRSYTLPKPRCMTWEEYLEWEPDEGIHAEWVNGKIEYLHLDVDPITCEVMMGVSFRHSDLAGFLEALLRFFVEFHRLGKIVGEPYTMFLTTLRTGRMADVMFIANQSVTRIQQQSIDGPVDLAIEIVSKSSYKRDRVTKLQEYEQGGVREYWIVDPITKECLFYQMGENGKYRLVSADADGKYHSAVLPGLWVKSEWFWQETLPSLIDVLKLWQLM